MLKWILQKSKPRRERGILYLQVQHRGQADTYGFVKQKEDLGDDQGLIEKTVFFYIVRNKYEKQQVQRATEKI